MGINIHSISLFNRTFKLIENIISVFISLLFKALLTKEILAKQNKGKLDMNLRMYSLFCTDMANVKILSSGIFERFSDI